MRRLKSSRSTGIATRRTPSGPKFNGANAAVQRRVVILHAGGHANDLRLDVLCNLANFFRAMTGAGKAIEGAGGGDHQRGRTGNPGAGGRFGIGPQGEAGARTEETQQVGRQRQAGLSGEIKLGKRLVGFLGLEVAGAQADFRTSPKFPARSA